MLNELVTSIGLKAVYTVAVGVSAEWHNPYFAHGESNIAFVTESNQLLYLHMGAYD